MKIKALWGWVGASGTVRSGDVIDVDVAYGHAMIGKGLATEVTDKEPAAKEAIDGEKQGDPAANKQAAPKETK